MVGYLKKSLKLGQKRAFQCASPFAHTVVLNFDGIKRFLNEVMGFFCHAAFTCNIFASAGNRIFAGNDLDAQSFR